MQCNGFCFYTWKPNTWYYVLVIFSALIHFDLKCVLDGGYFARSKHLHKCSHKTIFAFTLFLQCRSCLFFVAHRHSIHLVLRTWRFFFFISMIIFVVRSCYFGSFLNLILALHGNEARKPKRRYFLWHANKSDWKCLEHFIGSVAHCESQPFFAHWW